VASAAARKEMIVAMTISNLRAVNQRRPSPGRATNNTANTTHTLLNRSFLAERICTPTKIIPSTVDMSASMNEL
jgi:hypothetical protein